MIYKAYKKTQTCPRKHAHIQEKRTGSRKHALVQESLHQKKNSFKEIKKVVLISQID